MNKIKKLKSLILALGLAWIGMTFIQASEGLSELSKLKAENFKLKAQLNSCSLSIEQSQLTEQFRKELNEGSDKKFDWNSLSFIQSK